MGEKGKKRGPGEGGKGSTLSPPLTSSRLVSLADFFSPSTELDPRLRSNVPSNITLS